jgi:cysteinyl-tRNA synthetase
MVQVDNEKMSKSLDNFFTVREVLKQYDAESVRYFLINVHYRSQLNYSVDNLKQAKAMLERLITALRDVDVNLDVELASFAQVKRFNAAMDDDFNTPEALSVMFELAKELNKEKLIDASKASDLAGVLVKLGAVLGILQTPAEEFFQSGQGDEVEEIEQLIAKRNKARTDKDWGAADEARDALTAMGITLEDSEGKTTWRKI